MRKGSETGWEEGSARAGRAANWPRCAFSRAIHRKFLANQTESQRKRGWFRIAKTRSLYSRTVSTFLSSSVNYSSSLPMTIHLRSTRNSDPSTHFEESLGFFQGSFRSETLFHAREPMMRVIEELPKRRQRREGQLRLQGTGFDKKKVLCGWRCPA